MLLWALFMLRLVSVTPLPPPVGPVIFSRLLCNLILCAAVNSSGHGTLIICPNCVLKQWEKELEDKVKPGVLKVCHSQCL